MSGRRSVIGALLCFSAVAVLSCATPVARPTLTMEQHTLRIPLTVGPDGMVSFAERPPLTGRLDLSPILRAEGVRPATTKPKSVQIMLHYGRIYVVAEGFCSVWEITPRPGTSKASYRAIPILRASDGERLKNVRLSQYGSSRSMCLRLDRAGGRPVFITASGELRDDCS